MTGVKARLSAAYMQTSFSAKPRDCAVQNFYLCVKRKSSESLSFYFYFDSSIRVRGRSGCVCVSDVVLACRKQSIDHIRRTHTCIQYRSNDLFTIASAGRVALPFFLIFQAITPFFLPPMSGMRRPSWEWFFFDSVQSLWVFSSHQPLRTTAITSRMAYVHFSRRSARPPRIVWCIRERWCWYIYYIWYIYYNICLVCVCGG